MQLRSASIARSSRVAIGLKAESAWTRPRKYVYCMYLVVWDPAKARENIQKHGVRFSDAATVLDDPDARTIEDPRHEEQRFVTIGRDLEGRVLVVVYAYPDDADIVRLVSARRARASERKSYEEGR